MTGWEEVFYPNFCSLRQPEECSVMPHFHGKSTWYCSLFPDRLAWGAKGQIRTRNRIVPTHFLSSLGPCPPGVKKTGEMSFGWKWKEKVEMETAATPHCRRLTSQWNLVFCAFPPLMNLMFRVHKCSPQLSNVQPRQSPEAGSGESAQRAVNLSLSSPALTVPWGRDAVWQEQKGGMVGGLNRTICRTKPGTLRKDRHRVLETRCDDYGTRQYVPGHAETKHHRVHKRGSSHPLGRTGEDFMKDRILGSRMVR